MRTIWKYELDVVGELNIEMPVGAKVLCVQTQGGFPCLWAEVDDHMKKINRTFRVIGTGHDMEPVGDGLNGWKYVGTFQMHGGNLVFHVYDGQSDRSK